MERNIQPDTEKVENKSFESYRAFLKEQYKPPSKGGNTGALHQHVLKIDDETYSFLALGTKQWAYKNDTVSFKWEWDKTGKYRNIIPETFQAKNEKGEPIQRGIRGGKKTLRTMETRMPVSRREMNK